ncbi:MAG TPA: hypothetical protein PK859_02795 [Spirochaetota bacterium]|nr:hypothetical protein [Spirochaetota bacterium]HPR47243.1 hypothetical protein [Spirochaetota bacterium]
MGPPCRDRSRPVPTGGTLDIIYRARTLPSPDSAVMDDRAGKQQDVAHAGASRMDKKAPA